MMDTMIGASSIDPSFPLAHKSRIPNDKRYLKCASCVYFFPTSKESQIMRSLIRVGCGGNAVTIMRAVTDRNGRAHNSGRRIRRGRDREKDGEKSGRARADALKDLSACLRTTWNGRLRPSYAMCTLNNVYNEDRGL